MPPMQCSHELLMRDVEPWLTAPDLFSCAGWLYRFSDGRLLSTSESAKAYMACQAAGSSLPQVMAAPGNAAGADVGHSPASALHAFSFHMRGASPSSSAGSDAPPPLGHQPQQQNEPESELHGTDGGDNVVSKALTSPERPALLAAPLSSMLNAVGLLDLSSADADAGADAAPHVGVTGCDAAAACPAAGQEPLSPAKAVPATACSGKENAVSPAIAN